MTDDFEYFRDLCAALIGNCLEEDKTYLIEGRLQALAVREKADSVSALLTRLRSQPVGPLHWQAVEAATTRETLFFRDPALFELLATRVLEDVVAARRAARTLRIWSAACSTGQEPYSIAMLLTEAYPELRDWRVDIVASDVALEALTRARDGLYSRFEVDRGVSAERRSRHFERAGAGFRLRDPIRHMVRFERINLASAWPPLEVFDIILMRNVMLYFHEPLKGTIMERVHSTLATDGYLFLGAAENLLQQEDLFVPFVSGRAIGFRPQCPAPE